MCGESGVIDFRFVRHSQFDADERGFQPKSATVLLVQPVGVDESGGVISGCLADRG